jgi:hypothetical protein
MPVTPTKDFDKKRGTTCLFSRPLFHEQGDTIGGGTSSPFLSLQPLEADQSAVLRALQSGELVGHSFSVRVGLVEAEVAVRSR